MFQLMLSSVQSLSYFRYQQEATQAAHCLVGHIHLDKVYHSTSEIIFIYYSELSLIILLSVATAGAIESDGDNYGKYSSNMPKSYH